MLFCSNAQENSTPDFIWGNASYFNINIGESVFYNQTEIKLIQIYNHFNLLQVGTDSVWLKVSRRTLPEPIKNLRIFVADNRNVKAITDDNDIHGILKKDALICLSDINQPLLDSYNFVFPVSFNDGFTWSTEQDRHLFSYLGKTELNGMNFYRSHDGIDFDLNDAKGIEKHWIVAIENSKVVWIEEDSDEQENRSVSVLLESQLNRGIYYFYSRLYHRNLEVKKGQNVLRGELIGTAWGDYSRGFVHFSVIKSDTVPAYQQHTFNVVNFFPQIYELYSGSSQRLSKSFVKGTIVFGSNQVKYADQKNTLAFEEYSGKGWILGKWNTADKIPSVSKGEQSNARLNKILFAGTAAECRNPQNWFDYQINVRNGVYRIRAKVGDIQLPTWQKIEFEGINAGTLSLGKGEFRWTSERAVKVTDGKLTVRIFIDETQNTIAGISQIVFQRAN